MKSLFLIAFSGLVGLQVYGKSHHPHSGPLPSSAPHVYPGQPSGDYSTAWQSYFQVTQPLKGVGFDLPNNYAGNIAVQRAGHANNSLFFWGFEKTNGSLTAGAGESGSGPWGIWLNGGPGQSSMIGLLNENGPISIGASKTNGTMNKYAWNNLIDYIWVDNPVGVGFSTADSNGYAKDEEDVAADFLGFLDNLVKVFPSLATRPLYLSGESWAGRYISYIAKALFSHDHPPVKLSKIIVGDGAFGSVAEFETMPALSLIETYPQLIGYDTDVYKYFKQQANLCKLDINLTYPQTAPLAPINLSRGDPRRKPGHQQASDIPIHRVLDPKDKLKDRGSGTIDPWYGCSVYDELIDFALNFTFPWNTSHQVNRFDITQVGFIETEINPTWFLNDKSVVAAIHAPQKTWQSFVSYPWESKKHGHDKSPEPMTFMNELAANASAHNVQIIMFAGNDDALSPHLGTEVVIQNTTFGGMQGFSSRPSTAWFNDDGDWAGVIHKERNWTYALFYGAGHEVPIKQPGSAFTFMRDFVLDPDRPTFIHAVKSNPSLAQSALPGQPGIQVVSRSRTSTFVYPTKSAQAFASFVGLAPITGTSNIKGQASATSTSTAATHSSTPHGKDSSAARGEVGFVWAVVVLLGQALVAIVV